MLCYGVFVFRVYTTRNSQTLLLFIQKKNRVRFSVLKQ